MDKPARKPRKYQPLKILVGGADTRLARVLVDTLDNRHLHPDDHHRILGTPAVRCQEPANPKLRKMINPDKLAFFQDIVKDSDVIIYDLHSCAPVEAELVIKTLKMNVFAKQKLLIFISSVLAWSETPPKEKAEDEEDDGLFPEEPDS